MQTTMSNTMNMSLSRAAPLSSARRCSALASRPARLVRGNRMSVRAETDKSVESKTPDVNRNKPENIEAGNISNENAEKRADIGKNREPTPAGTKATSNNVFHPEIRDACPQVWLPRCVLRVQRHRPSTVQHRKPSTADSLCWEWSPA